MRAGPQTSSAGAAPVRRPCVRTGAPHRARKDRRYTGDLCSGLALVGPLRSVSVHCSELASLRTRALPDSTEGCGETWPRAGRASTMTNHDALSPTRGVCASELEADLQLNCSHVHRPVDRAEPCRRRAEASRIDVAVREKLRVANRLVLRADELQLGDARVVDDRVQRVVHLHAQLDQPAGPYVEAARDREIDPVIGAPGQVVASRFHPEASRQRTRKRSGVELIEPVARAAAARIAV